MAKLKLLIISHEFPPDKGGAGSVAFDMASHLERRGHEVTVLTSRKGGALPQHPFRTLCVTAPPKVFSLFYWRRVKELGPERFDAIILNDLGAAQVAAFFFGDELLKRCVVFLHGNEPEEIATNLYFRLFFSRCYRSLLRRCRFIVAVSEFMKRKFLERTGWSEVEEKVRVRRNGVDTAFFFPERVDLHARYGIERSRRLLLTVGRLVVGKGYLEMTDAFAELTRRKDAFHWLIVGDGPDRGAIEAHLERRGVGGRVTVISEAARHELRGFYSSVDLFWLLSNFEESFGLVYLESNACGTPVLGRETGGVGEAIRHGKSGFLTRGPLESVEIILRGGYRELPPAGIMEHAKEHDIASSIDTISSWLGGS